MWNSTHTDIHYYDLLDEPFVKVYESISAQPVYTFSYASVYFEADFTFDVLGMIRPQFALWTSLQMQHVIGVIPY